MTRKTAAMAALMMTACAAVAPENARGPEGQGASEGWEAAVGTPTASRADREALALAIDSIPGAAVEGGEVVGLSIAVLRGGEPVRVRGYGFADLEGRVAATDSTRYYIGSITKPMTAAAILRLAESGRLDLDDDVLHHLPELRSPGPPVTLRHLLTHTSGLAGPAQVAPKFLERRHLEFSAEELLDLLQDEPRVTEPGERLAYNNLGYVLLGLVAERVSGQSFEDHLHTGVLAPAEARSVMLCDPRRIIPHRARGYQIQDGVVVHHEPVNASLVFAAGGLCANALDVARWFRALHQGEVVSLNAARRMATPGELRDGTALSYGYGLALDPLQQHARVHHGGDVNGFSSYAAHYTEDDVTVVVLTNTRGPAARRIEQEIARLMLGIPEAPGVAASERESFVGTYEAGSLRLRIFEADSDLWLDQGGQPRRIVSMDDGTYGVDGIPTLRLRFLVREGEAHRMIVMQASGSVELARIE